MVITSKNKQTTCCVRNTLIKRVPRLYLRNMCGFFFSTDVQHNPKSGTVGFFPLKPVLFPKLLWLKTLVPLGVCYSQPLRCQLNSCQEL